MPVDYPRVTNLELILEAHLEDPTSSDQELYARESSAPDPAFGPEDESPRRRAHSRNRYPRIARS
jgi:hypothetical protein